MKNVLKYIGELIISKIIGNRDRVFIYDPVNLKYNEVSIIYKLFKYSLLFIIIISTLSISIVGGRDPNELTEYEKILIIEESNKFSEEKLILKIKNLNFKYPHIILAQAKLESNNYSSKIFIESNNLFGMKEAQSRINLAKGTQYNHAYYNNWNESLLDYAFWYSSYAYRCTNESQLFELLGNQYAEDSSYTDKLKSMINKNKLKDKFK